MAPPRREGVAEAANPPEEKVGAHAARTESDPQPRAVHCSFTSCRSPEKIRNRVFEARELRFRLYSCNVSSASHGSVAPPDRSRFGTLWSSLRWLRCALQPNPWSVPNRIECLQPRLAPSFFAAMSDFRTMHNDRSRAAARRCRTHRRAPPCGIARPSTMHKP
eukprot:1339829-Prymnesium_polylepis.1